MQILVFYPSTIRFYQVLPSVCWPLQNVEYDEVLEELQQCKPPAQCRVLEVSEGLTTNHLVANNALTLSALVGSSGLLAVESRKRKRN